MSVDHLARDYLKMALLLPMPTADVAAIQPNHDRFGWLRHRLLRCLGDQRLHNGLADPQRPAPHRAGVVQRLPPSFVTLGRTAERAPGVLPLPARNFS